MRAAHIETAAMSDRIQDQLKAETSIIQVGGGRGFVVADARHKELPPLVITAAHCVPLMPPAQLARYLHEQTFLLLGPLFGKLSVYAEVLFYDPIADVAVLGQPDTQAMYEAAEAYELFLAEYTPLKIAVPSKCGEGFLHDLAGTRQPIKYQCWQGLHKEPWLHVEGYTFNAGMSGSPILNMQGRALAVVSTSSGSGNLSSPCLSAAIPSRIRVRVTGGAK